MGTEITRRPGRPRGFDVATALDGAVDLFWELGYEATTTRDLERRLNVSQSSLYNAFGSKKALLLAAIDRYEERIRRELFSILTDDGGGVDAVGRFIAALGRWIVTNEHRGCLVVNLMASASDDPDIGARAAAYRSTIREALNTAFAAEARVTSAEAAQRSEAALAGVLGLHVTARSSFDPTEVENMVAALCHQVDSWS